MFKINKAIAAFAAVPMATALVAVGLVAGPAAADPPPPTGASYCGVGSDTTQDVVQALAGTVDSGSPNFKKIESWNARPTGSSITTNCAAGSFPRPDGSSAGINALRVSLGFDSGCGNPGQPPCNSVSYARSSRGPNDTSTSDLMWIPFAVDGVAPAVLDAAKAGRPGALDLWFQSDRGIPPAGIDPATFTDIQNIYKCVTTSITVTGKTYQVVPYVPQAGSGTRSFWLTAMGITEADVNKSPALGGCVRDTKISTGAQLQEHDGTVLTDPSFNPTTSTWDTSCDAGDTCYTEMIPISIAQWIAQTNHLTTGVTDRRGNAKLLPVDGQNPTVAGPPLKINASYPPKFLRDVYNVFKRTSVSGLSADADLKKLFVGNSSAVCTQTAIINKYGFLTNANCGDTSGAASKTGKK